MIDRDLRPVLQSIPGCRVVFEEPLCRYTGFRTGGKAEVMAWPSDLTSVIALLDILKRFDVPCFFLGNGTNVLAVDSGYAGCVVLTGALDHFEVRPEENRVICGCGVSLSNLCVQCAKAGLAGVEFAYGIPGTVGGAVCMNAGAFEGEMKDVVWSVKTAGLTGTVSVLGSQDLNFGYRDSAFQHNDQFLLEADLRLIQRNKEEILKKMRENAKNRQAKQPLDFPSCGSVFKRPKGAYAAKLIDECGLRGFQIGGAAVSEKHAGFIVNCGNATSNDVLEVIAHVRQTVADATGFLLECEITILQ